MNHKNVSFVKSILRIVGFILLLSDNSRVGGVVILVIAEILGIVEEEVDDKVNK